MVHLLRLSFFLEIWKFQKFPVPFCHFYPVWSPSSFRHEKLQDGGEFFDDRTLNAKWSAIIQACSWSKTKMADSLENCGLVVPNFLWVSSPSLHTLPREKFVSFSHKHQGRVEFWMRVKLFHVKQFNTSLETATSFPTFSNRSCNSWWEIGRYTPYSKMAATQDGLGRVAWKRGIKGHGTNEIPWGNLLSGPSFLTEDDIPGSSLYGRGANRLKNYELKFWLKCHCNLCKGLSTKAQLCKR